MSDADYAARHAAIVENRSRALAYANLHRRAAVAVLAAATA